MRGLDSEMACAGQSRVFAWPARLHHPMNHDDAQSSPGLNTPDQRLRILIADDFPEWRIQIRKILNSRPEWEVIFEASHGHEAFQKSVELRPDIVLLDIGMPVMNGFQAALRIRQGCPGSHIIFVTHTRDEAVMRAALEMGAEGYVLKANIASELLPAIAAALANDRKAP